MRALRQNSCTFSSEREKHTDTDIQCRRVCAYVYVCMCHSVMSDSLQPRGLLPTRLLYPWDSPGKNTEDIVIPFSRGCSWPRYLTWVSYISRQILYHLSQQGSLCRRIHTAKGSEKLASRYKVIYKEWEWDKPMISQRIWLFSRHMCGVCPVVIWKETRGTEWMGSQHFKHLALVFLFGWTMGWL